MGISRVVTVRRDIAHPRELVAPHIVHAVTPYGIKCSFVLFILTIRLYSQLTA